MKKIKGTWSMYFRQQHIILQLDTYKATYFTLKVNRLRIEDLKK